MSGICEGSQDNVVNDGGRGKGRERRCDARRAPGVMTAVRRAFAAAVVTVASLGMLAACSVSFNGNGANGADSDKVQTFEPSKGKAEATLNIASGSENKEVADAIQQAVDDSGVAVTMNYMGSLDIMSALKNGGDKYDAVWPASSMWISMGDTKHIVKDAASTSTTPIVFGIAKSKAEQLGWADASGKTKPVKTADILAAVSSGKLKFSMTSATQSNSGASAYLAFMTALTGRDEPLTAADLNDAKLTGQVAALLKGVDRSSGSSDWLKDMVVANPDRFDSMVNYESLVIQADKQLEKAGHDPLVAIYPADGIAVSDSPLGYVDRGQNLDDAFAKFQKALSSKDSKLLFERAGRRTGLGGTLAYGSDNAVKQSFRAEWGIDTSADTLKTIALPAASVIDQALTVYQTKLRKPSYTIWVVDYSGSMSGDGKDGVVNGLTSALDPTKSARYHIEPSSEDVNVLIPFSSAAETPVTAHGTDTGDLLKQAQDRAATGGTNIYDGLSSALSVLPSNLDDYTTAIVLMTDGQSETFDKSSFESRYHSSGRDLPIFSIMFGDADPAQLNELAKLSNAKVFDGRSGDLAAVFRQVKGFN
ncbi:vWA domain-containing protein [Bifidobacterium biavatii]|uniref:von Willebrand factor type A (VWA) domain-containing protein n=1 Tax=Bifidobacterium biavatii DSM 23969 TaxID=1437608 RepID=A0A086ZNK3_9BIFI|nr:VWA domain-containing protein [Bifidobacterium biavatii]KFI48103.1 von Willebrand factor type A (vWA) domain-containing protein [Bifidobacterium biavatii DSM 23969]